MTTVVALRPHTQAVLQALGGLGDTGVYDGKGPASPHEHVPYIVVRPYLPRYDGPTADIAADVDYRVTLACAGTSQAMTEDTADRARVALLDPAAALAPVGRLMRGPVTYETLRSCLQDEDPLLVTPMWTVLDLYTIPTTPG